jgi:hypothetical protein
MPITPRCSRMPMLPSGWSSHQASTLAPEASGAVRPVQPSGGGFLRRAGSGSGDPHPAARNFLAAWASGPVMPGPR